MALPGCGLRIQAVIHVETDQTIARDRQRRRMQQDGRVESAAETDDDSAGMTTQNCRNGVFNRERAHAADRR